MKKRSDEILKKIQEINEDKDNRALLSLLKGKALSLFPEYNKQTEDHLSKALRLDPTLIECWNLLGKELWKKRDWEGAKKMFETALEKCGGKSASSLRYLSIIMRAIPN